MRSDEEKSGGSNISSRGRRPETVARQRIRGQIGFSSMAAQNKPQRVIKVSADEYLEELKKMYFKTKYIRKGPHSDTGGVSFHDTGGVAFHGRLRIAICGHVDTHSASTGRLIFELESLSECEKDRLEQEALELHQSRDGSFFRNFLPLLSELVGERLRACQDQCEHQKRVH